MLLGQHGKLLHVDRSGGEGNYLEYDKHNDEEGDEDDGAVCHKVLISSEYILKNIFQYASTPRRGVFLSLFDTMVKLL